MASTRRASSSTITLTALVSITGVLNKHHDHPKAAHCPQWTPSPSTRQPPTRADRLNDKLRAWRQTASGGLEILFWSGLAVAAPSWVRRCCGGLAYQLSCHDHDSG